MIQSLLISAILIGTIELLALLEVRRKHISPWVALAVICLVSSISGIYIVYSKGDNLIGAMCLSPILAIAFGFPALIIAFVMKSKE
jgi:hypothetical protein